MATWRLAHLVMVTVLVSMVLATAGRGEVATPEAGEDARWLTDPANLDCVTDTDALPGTVAAGWRAYPLDSDVLPFAEAQPEDREAVAEVFRALQACDRSGSGAELDAFFSENAVLMPPLGQAQRDEMSVATAREISEALGVVDPLTFVIEGKPLPADASTGGPMTASRRVLLPGDVVQLADSRLGAPLRLFVRTNAPEGAAFLLGQRGFLETGFLIFTIEDVRWVIDQVLTICLGDCDGFWQAYEGTGTPVASPVAVPENRSGNA